jgi:hypothetical protein
VPAAYAPPPPSQEKPPRDVRIASAHVDRVAFLPTAETHPSGTWYVTGYFIIPQIGVAVSDRTQISLTGFAGPFERDPLVLTDLSVKSVLARGYRYRLAAIGAVSGLIGFEAGFGFIGRAGFVAQLCFEDTCRSSVNVSTNMGFAAAVIMLNGVGAVLKVSELVSLLGEGAILIGAGPGGVEEAHGAAVDVGLRLSRERWGLDFAIGSGAQEGQRPGPFGLIAFTYRFLP